MEFCTYGKILVAILIKDKKLLYFKVSKFGQILYVDKTGFLRPSHIYCYIRSLHCRYSRYYITFSGHMHGHMGA